MRVCFVRWTSAAFRQTSPSTARLHKANRELHVISHYCLNAKKRPSNTNYEVETCQVSTPNSIENYPDFTGNIISGALLVIIYWYVWIGICVISTWVMGIMS